MRKFIPFLVIAILLWAVAPAMAMQSQRSAKAGFGSQTWELVEIASNETTIVSDGAVLVYDVSNAPNSAQEAAWRVKVADASADAIFVAGIAQSSIATGDQALILVRGPGTVKVNTESAAGIASGDDVWVGASGDVTEVTSTTHDFIGFSLENGASGDTTIEAYITIV